MSFEQRIAKRLHAQTERGLLRQAVVCTPDPNSPGRILRGGQSLLDFSSNDYLGLRSEPGLRQAFAEAAQRYGVGAGASHLLGGHHPEHARLEAQLCEWTNRPAAALFASGFQAALGVFGAFVEATDTVFADRLSHACLLDGARASGATLRRFSHNDLTHAKELMQRRSSGAESLSWLVSESVFSMDGDQAPVAGLANLARRQNASLILDEAHALGVLGPEGAGLASANSLSVDDCPVLMLTFGKALASAGAAIVGAQATIDAIINFSRPWIYTTAMPPALAAATGASVQRLRSADDLRARLEHNIAHFRHQAEQLGLPLAASTHAIQPVMLGGKDVVAISRGLMDAGFYVPAVRSPTVPKHTERLRVSLSSTHQPSQISALCQALARAAN